jgi:hypothetical protein
LEAKFSPDVPTAVNEQMKVDPVILGEVNQADPMAEEVAEKAAPNVGKATAGFPDPNVAAKTKEQDPNIVETDGLDKVRNVLAVLGNRSEAVSGVAEVGVEAATDLVFATECFFWVKISSW